MSVLPAAAAFAGSLSADWFATVSGDLLEAERLFVRALASPRSCVERLIQRLDGYRGKRLRPALLLLTAKACGSVVPAHHTLAAVVEMIHTATLVHDDVLDDATIRRHRPTVNVEYGNRSSILLGDFLFTHAFHLASSVDARACALIGHATNRVCEGELQQNVESGNLDLTEEAYLDIVDGKTAELTSCCCRLGALYSGADETVVEALSRYGRWLGVAFQIADDVLDLTGEERTAGKSLGTDLQKQKLTLPLIRLLADAPAGQAGVLRQLLNSPGNHKREALLPHLVDNGAITYAGCRAEEFAGRARAELSCLPSTEFRTILERLTERVVHRQS